MERWHDRIGGRTEDIRDNTGEMSHTRQDGHHWSAGIDQR